MTIQKHIQHMLARLDTSLPPGRYYGLAVVIALVYTFSLFPLDFFSGRAGFWIDTRTDPTQHITGMWAFVQDKWRFPLLHTVLLNAPEGVAVVFTDSIPIAALLFKPIYSLLPPGSHYFGAWVLGCYLLQGVAGATATAVIGGRTVAGCIAGTLFAAMMPSLMIRIPHAALLAQCLLLFMLILYYLYHKKNISPRRFLSVGTGLLILSASIHPYLLAMLYAIYASASAAYALRERGRGAWTRLMLQLFTPLPLLALLLYSLGYIGWGKGLPPAEVGFDQNSMNLLSPVLGTHLAPSRFLPSERFVLDATGLQIDGHNYLGLGLIAMLVYGAVFQPSRLARLLKAHWVMAMTMAGLTVYALSNVVYLADSVIATYPVPELIQPLTKIFRGSGRFFWPVGYALLLAALGLFLTRPNIRYRVALLLLLALQYVDLKPHREYLAEAAHRDPVFAHDREVWDQRVRNATSVYVFPTYGCGASGSDALFLQYFTALHAVPFNSGFVARASSDCSAKEQVLAAPRRPGELFIFLQATSTTSEINASMKGNASRWCVSDDIGLVCGVPRS